MNRELNKYDNTHFLKNWHKGIQKKNNNLYHKIDFYILWSTKSTLGNKIGITYFKLQRKQEVTTHLNIAHKQNKIKNPKNSNQTI